MRNRDLLLRLLLPAALLLGAVALSAAAPMTKVTVQVKSLSGKPIDMAEVIVQWNADPKHPRSSFGKNVSTKFEMRTNQEGEAAMPRIPQGNIRISINAKGYQTFGRVFAINEEEKTVEIKLNPPQQQYTSH